MTTPYILPADVAAYLGVTFSSGQLPVAQAKVDAAIAYVGRVTLQSWNLDPITGEQYTLSTDSLLLRNVPVTSVEQIQVRQAIVGDPLEPLVAGEDYELLDPARGLLLFARVCGAQSLAFVDYTPNRPVPADIQEACVLIAGASLYLTLNAGRWGVTRGQVDADTAVVYTDAQLEIQVPAKAAAILKGYRPPVWG